MDLENVLGVLEAAERAAAGRQGGGIVRDPVRYFVTVFGNPSGRDPWGWRVEGHHVSLHFTVVNGNVVADPPSFFGSNPAEVHEARRRGCASSVRKRTPAVRSCRRSTRRSARRQFLIRKRRAT